MGARFSRDLCVRAKVPRSWDALSIPKRLHVGGSKWARHTGGWPGGPSIALLRWLLVLESHADRLRLAGNAELLVDPFDVRLHGSLGNSEQRAHLAI